MFNGVEVRGIEESVDDLNPIPLESISHFVCSMNRVAQTTEVAMRCLRSELAAVRFSLRGGSCRLGHFDCILFLIVAGFHLVRCFFSLAG